MAGSVVGGVVAGALDAGDGFEHNVVGSVVAIAAAVVPVVPGTWVRLLRRGAR